MLRRLCLLLALGLPGIASAAPFDRFSDVAVFGDSLSDPVVPGLPFPGFPGFYSNGQVTNGDTWAVQLGFDDPASNNFAQASATARDEFQDQIDAFTGLGKTLGDTALAMVWLGGNDIGRAVETATTSIARINEALTAMASGLDNLALAGFDKALVFLVPDIGHTPRLQAVDTVFPGAAALATSLTGAYNHGLMNISASMTESLELGFVNVPGLVSSAIADPAAFGFTNVEDACIARISGGGPFFVPPCSTTTVDEFLYYDDFHPTDNAHGHIAALATTGASALAPIPLPAGMVLLVSALGALGLVGWQRRRAGA